MTAKRAAMLGFAMLLIAVPSLAEDASRLSRQKVELLAPPFVHSHQQATTEDPKIIEFRLVVQEKAVVIDDIGTTLQAMTFGGSIPGPLMVVHEGDYVELTLVNPKSNSMHTQHRFPCRNWGAWRWHADADQSGRAGGAALQGDARRRLYLSLRSWRYDDSMARRIRHERCDHGAATQRSEGWCWQCATL